MLTALASAGHPALKALGTRDDDDFTIALIDAWAAVCEVLSFYQERHANEAYIQTARERLSIGGIARLIGYQLQPGAAAETDLVLLMDDPPGAEPTAAARTIPRATRIRSTPGPDEEAQVFETLAPLLARVAWNRLRPRQNRTRPPQLGDTHVWLQGQTTGLRPGDAILLVGHERSEADPGSERWDFRRLTRVQPDAARDRTRVEWDRGLGSLAPAAAPAQESPRFFALREQTALFGHNAPHPLVLAEDTRTNFGLTGSGDWTFDLDPDATQIALDGERKSFVKGGWVALTVPAGYVGLYRIEDATAGSLSKYAVSGRATRLTLDTTEDLWAFAGDYRGVAAYGASEEIALADTPRIDRVSGPEVELDGRAPDLPEGRRLVLSGRRAQVRVAKTGGLRLTYESRPPRDFPAGARLTLAAPPQPIEGTSGKVRWHLEDIDGAVATADLPDDALSPVPADESAGTVAEVATLDHADTSDLAHTTLVLTGALGNAFDRANLAIHANVAHASHGESTSEILGGGDPSRPFQSFTLKQHPVTHRVAPTGNGVASTLALRIDGIEWREVPDLYVRGAGARVFATHLTDAGETVIRFGDGSSGARPPPGRDNLLADYRKGLGRAGNVPARRIDQPLDRSLGLREAVNPRPASGGSDPEAPEEARRNAPVRTLTLGRLVSITDYRDFALGYPGIARADARWVWDGWTRRIVVTVAGTDGATLAPDGPISKALREAFADRGDPFAQVDLISYAPAHFRLGLRVATHPTHAPETVRAGVEDALRTGFAFAARDFAEPVALSRIAAVAHTVPGVLAVHIDTLYRDRPPQTARIAHTTLVARTGRLGSHGALLPGEILTLSPDPLDALAAMS